AGHADVVTSVSDTGMNSRMQQRGVQQHRGRTGMPYFGLIVLVVWVVCLIDVISAEEHRVRNLPKTLWLFVVILLPLVGSVLWLVAGRPFSGAWSRPQSSAFPEYERPGRHIAQQTEADEEFLRR